MGSVCDEARGAFLAASEFFVGLVAATPQGCYDRPGLGHWSVLELIAHGNRAHTTVVDYVEGKENERDSERVRQAEGEGRVVRVPRRRLPQGDSTTGRA